jgi:hypothetical protein
LSDKILIGSPLLDVNRLNPRRNAVAVISDISSMCTALVTQHVKRQIHTFLDSDDKFSLVYNGPA